MSLTFLILNLRKYSTKKFDFFFWGGVTPLFAPKTVMSPKMSSPIPHMAAESFSTVKIGMFAELNIIRVN